MVNVIYTAIPEVLIIEPTLFGDRRGLADGETGRIPVLRPQLPRAERLLPYLQEIDNTRIYSNHGPLHSRLQARLSALFGVTAAGVQCANSGTSGIIAAILA
jgi:hypothetical protein